MCVRLRQSFPSSRCRRAKTDRADVSRRSATLRVRCDVDVQFVQADTRCAGIRQEVCLLAPRELTFLFEQNLGLFELPRRLLLVQSSRASAVSTTSEGVEQSTDAVAAKSFVAFLSLLCFKLSFTSRPVARTGRFASSRVAKLARFVVDCMKICKQNMPDNLSASRNTESLHVRTPEPIHVPALRTPADRSHDCSKT